MPDFVNKSAAWSWQEAPEMDENGQPTGYTVLRVATRGTETGYYDTVVEPSTSLFARAASVQSIWDNMGPPA